MGAKVLSADRPEPIRQEFLFDYYVELTSHATVPYDLGMTPYGHRVLGGISSGWIDGPKIKGTIVEGFDFGIVRRDDISVPDVRLVIRTDDDAYFIMTYTAGVMGPWSQAMAKREGRDGDQSKIDWRATYSFETSSEKYAWLNRTLAAGRGMVTDTGFLYRVYELL